MTVIKFQQLLRFLQLEPLFLYLFFLIKRSGRFDLFAVVTHTDSFINTWLWYSA